MAKNAEDLRKAMDMTESSASQTIQELERMNSRLQVKIEKAETILADASLEKGKRIQKALNILASQTRMHPAHPPDNHTFTHLEETVARLRGEGGCPWDKKQTPQSLKKYLQEECDELIEAIDQENKENIAEEIGDLFFVLTLLITFFSERREFNSDDVFSQIIAKMIRRHPHVFAGSPLPEEGGLSTQWERIKAQEKHGACSLGQKISS